MDLPLPLADFLTPPDPLPVSGAGDQAAQGFHSTLQNVDTPFASMPVTLGPGGISGNPQVISRSTHGDLPLVHVEHIPRAGGDLSIEMTTGAGGGAALSSNAAPNGVGTHSSCNFFARSRSLLSLH